MSNKKIYLINKQDRYCPENNNGDYFIAAFSDEEKAQVFAYKKDEEDKFSKHFIVKMNLDEEE